jgi:hypothetical protein
VLDERDGLPSLPMLDFTLAYSESAAEERSLAVLELGRLIEQAEWARQDKPGRRNASALRAR